MAAVKGRKSSRAASVVSTSSYRPLSPFVGGHYAIGDHARPLLTRKNITDMLGDATFSFLAGSKSRGRRGARSPRSGRPPLEEMSKLWSVFFQTPYSLSIGYRASVVSIEADERPRASQSRA